jgi:subtilisin family serine protease
MPRPFAAFLALAFAIPALAGDAPRKKIERADQLPTRAYPLPMKPSALIQDAAATDALAAALRKDLEADLRDYDIEDKATRISYLGALTQIAVLQGRLDDALALSAQTRDLQEKPALKLLTGLLLRPLVASKRAPGAARAETYLQALRKELAALPYEQVQAELKSMKASFEIMSANLMVGMAEERLDPAAKGGSLPQDMTIGAVGTAYRLRETLPVKDPTVKALAEVIEAHKVDKPDIWAARNVTLDPKEKLTPVVVAIWDTGVDLKLFPGKAWVNGKEIPGNGKDDDANGWVDDVSGIAFDWYGKKVPGMLGPVEIPAEALASAARDAKGYSELQAGLETPDTAALKKKMAALSKDQARPFVESLTFFSTWGHGTHVAGIATAGNPAARILVIRAEYPWRMIPPVPDDAWAAGQVRLMKESVAYLVAGGARVVNMSWGFSPKEFEEMLEANGVGTPESRRAMARRWLDAIAAALREAMTSAPNVLFVPGAGNANSDARFEEFVPSSFDLPNTLTAGAVDRAGDEAAFTSYGKVDVYANGYQVESVVPGGAVQAWSGTSMAAPQVANLAAKILARHPDLTAVQVKKLILDGAQVKEVAGRKLRILDPRRSLELAAAAR